MVNVYEQLDNNKRKSIIVIVLFIVFIAFFIWIMGKEVGFGPGIVGWALIFSGLSGLGGYYFSDQIILTISKARAADKKKDFNFFTATENLAMASSIPMPKLYVIEDSAPNAFATGRSPSHAVICATTGLLEKLDRSELEGVIAHELTHVKNYDMRLMSVVAVLVGMVTLLADWFIRISIWGGRGDREEKGNSGAIIGLIAIFLAILSPIIAELIKLAISRRREFYADAGSAYLTRYPEGLIRALEKISKDKEPLEAANKATAHLYIVNPLKNTHNAIGRFAKLFNTHPPVEDRIKALQGMI